MLSFDRNAGHKKTTLTLWVTLFEKGSDTLRVKIADFLGLSMGNVGGGCRCWYTVAVGGVFSVDVNRGVLVSECS